MAKNAITDFDTTAAGNTDIGGVGIQGTDSIANADNAIREIAEILADTNAGTAPWADTMTIGDAADLTKEVRFELSGITPGQTRVITVPDANVTIPSGTLMAAGSYPTVVSLEGLTLNAGDMLYATAADTVADLPIGTAGQFLVTNAGATAPEWASRPTLVSLEGLSLVAGDILYATAADTLARLPKGTAAQLLAMNGGATAPEWVTPTTTGYTLLGTITTTTGSSRSLTSLTLTGYKFLLCTFDGVSTNSSSGSVLQNSQTLWTQSSAADAAYGGLQIDLTNSSAWAVVSDDLGFGVVKSFLSNVSTASTSITFTTGATFDAGSIRVYGVS